MKLHTHFTIFLYIFAHILNYALNLANIIFALFIIAKYMSYKLKSVVSYTQSFMEIRNLFEFSFSPFYNLLVLFTKNYFSRARKISSC